jgi:hypothetical protein
MQCLGKEEMEYFFWQELKLLASMEMKESEGKPQSMKRATTAEALGRAVSKERPLYESFENI